MDDTGDSNVFKLPARGFAIDARAHTGVAVPPLVGIVVALDEGRYSVGGWTGFPSDPASEFVAMGWFETLSEALGVARLKARQLGGLPVTDTSVLGGDLDGDDPDPGMAA